MTTETFFKKFELLSDAPNAVRKMRELVLEWAVTGKLCHNTVVGWKAIVLGDVIKLISGQHLLANAYNDEGRGIPYLTGPSDFGDVSPIPTRWTEKPKVIAQPGDILITVKGSGVGKTNIVVDRPTAISRQLMAIRVTDADVDFIQIVLKRAAGYFQNMKTGIAIPGIGRREVLSLKVVLPPLDEQKRIVAKVYELMALCDKLEEQQKERETKHSALARASLSRFANSPTPGNLQFLFHKSYAITPADLRKSILSLAVQGKLVPQNSNDESAAELLNQISAEGERLVKACKIRRFDTTPLREDEKPFKVPSSWVWTKLGQIGDWGSGSTPPRANNEYYGGDVSWLKSGELNDSRSLLSSEETVTELALKRCSFRLNKPGDVLLAMYGATIGKAAILSECAVTNQAICGCTPFNGVSNIYLFNYLLSQRNAFHAASEGGAQPNISKVKIVSYPFPLPPLAEQRRIVKKVDELMALVEKLEILIETSRKTAENLLDAVVSEITQN